MVFEYFFWQIWQGNVVPSGTVFTCYLILTWLNNNDLEQFTAVRFASFLSGGFTTMAVINPPEKRLTKRTSVQFCNLKLCVCFLFLGMLKNKCSSNVVTTDDSKLRRLPEKKVENLKTNKWRKRKINSDHVYFWFNEQVFPCYFCDC